MQKILKSQYLDEFTIIISKPNELIFDKRAFYCCKVKCSNFKTRCFCPPYSYRYQKEISKKKFVIILVKTYDFSELNHFKNFPEDYNEEYLFKKRVFVRRWVQSHYYKRIKEFFLNWDSNSDDIFAGGFSLKRCNNCYSNAMKRKDCSAFPSPEALGIDVQKSLEKLNYFFKFGVTDNITKVSMIFSNKSICESNYGAVIRGKNNISLAKLNVTKDLEKKLVNLFPEVCFEKFRVEDIENELKSEFKWLKLWKFSICWSSNKKRVTLIKKIHATVFMENNYFSLDFIPKNIFRSDSELIKYDGIEFY